MHMQFSRKLVCAEAHEPAVVCVCVLLRRILYTCITSFTDKLSGMHIHASVVVQQIMVSTDRLAYWTGDKGTNKNAIRSHRGIWDARTVVLLGPKPTRMLPNVYSAMYGSIIYSMCAIGYVLQAIYHASKIMTLLNCPACSYIYSHRLTLLAAPPHQATDPLEGVALK